MAERRRKSLELHGWMDKRCLGDSDRGIGPNHKIYGFFPYKIIPFMNVLSFFS